MNLLVTDGRAVAATAWGDSLCWRAGQDGTYVASEPLDEEEWSDVPDRSLVTADASGVQCHQLS